MHRAQRNITTGLIAATLFFTLPASAGEMTANPSGMGDTIAGKGKSELCQGCHGEDGNSLSDLVPKIAGQNRVYIAKQIHNFQSGVRSHRIMNDLAVTVSDEDIADIATYFSSQEKMKGDGSVTNKIGEKLFNEGDATRKISACASCHGVNGKGLEPNPEMIPVIGGQTREYLHKQLVNFKKGDRSNSPEGIMNRITAPLSNDELEALAAYISSR